MRRLSWLWLRRAILMNGVLSDWAARLIDIWRKRLPPSGLGASMSSLSRRDLNDLSGRVVGAPGCPLLSGRDVGAPGCPLLSGRDVFNLVSVGGRLPRAPARRSALPPPPCSHAPPTERRGCCARGRSLWAVARGRRASRGWLLSSVLVGLGRLHPSVLVDLGRLHPSVLVGLGRLHPSVLVGLVGRWVFCFFLRGCCVVGC